MNQWDFVVAAYAVALLVVAALIVASAYAMRRAEARVNQLGRQ